MGDGEITLTITDITGNEQVVQVSTDITVKKLKELCLPKNFTEGKFLSPTCPSRSDGEDLTCWKLIHPVSGQTLNESNHLNVYQLKHDDNLVFIRKRTMLQSFPHSKQKGKPDMNTIASSTADIEAKNQSRKADDPVSFIDFHGDIRKILITLINVAYKILCYDHDAVEMFKEATEVIEAGKKSSKSVDPLKLRQLIEMGFDAEQGKIALCNNDMKVDLAMEWLLGNEGNVAIASEAESTNQEEYSQNEGLAVMKRFREMSFRPCEKALTHLLEMGFEFQESLDALRVNCNNQANACNWLLGDRSPSVEEFQAGMSPSSHIYKAIMNSPVIQLALNNPKTLLALEDMLEHPNNMHQYLNDPDTGPLLVQVSNIYSSERHIKDTSSSPPHG